MPSYTLVVTSCDRHDLLRQTLDSFIATAEEKPYETLIVEDSKAPEPDWFKSNWPYYFSRLGKVSWIQNDARMGQIWSIDRAYQLVKTDYIFHCEDDWQFNERGYIRDSFAILEKYPKIIQVSLRGCDGWHDLIDLPPYEGFKIAMPYWRGHWGGISFNPGMRRTSDYKKLGSYGLHVSYGTHGLGHEATLSQMMLDKGYRIADLGRPIAVHTGGSRSRAIEPIDWKLPKILIAVPACHAYEYGKWESEKSPSFGKFAPYNGKPYGTDIHISEPSKDRIKAVAGTWARDAAKLGVDVRYFYGQGTQEMTAGDQIFLPCPDDYEHLPHKTVAICKWALEHEYDYMLKVDDDTAVYVDRAIRELMSNRFDYAGCLHHGVCTGGPGYWLSRRAMKEVARNGVQNHWAEDVTVCKIMTNANIYGQHLSGHKSGLSEHWFFGSQFDEKKLSGDEVSIHAVQPEVMREWYAHARQGALGIQVQHAA